MTQEISKPLTKIIMHPKIKNEYQINDDKEATEILSGTETTLNVAPKIINNYQKYKDYRTQWRIDNRTMLNDKAKKHYIKKVETTPEFREILNERTKKNILKASGRTEPRPVGRPKKPKPDEEPKPILKRGRPRKYQVPI